MTERAGARATSAHRGADRKRDFVCGQIEALPLVDHRAYDQAAVKAVVGDDFLDPRGLPVLKPRVAELDHRRDRSDRAGNLGALIRDAARRQRGAS